jgi:hypothetical protein
VKIPGYFHYLYQRKDRQKKVPYPQSRETAGSRIAVVPVHSEVEVSDPSWQLPTKHTAELHRVAVVVACMDRTVGIGTTHKNWVDEGGESTVVDGTVVAVAVVVAAAAVNHITQADTGGDSRAGADRLGIQPDLAVRLSLVVEVVVALEVSVLVEAAHFAVVEYNLPHPSHPQHQKDILAD